MYIREDLRNKISWLYKYQQLDVDPYNFIGKLVEDSLKTYSVPDDITIPLKDRPCISPLNCNCKNCDLVEEEDWIYIINDKKYAKANWIETERDDDDDYRIYFQELPKENEEEWDANEAGDYEWRNYCHKVTWDELPDDFKAAWMAAIIEYGEGL